MILRHNKNICNYDKSMVFEDTVLKSLLKRITPYHTLVENQELFDSFATTIGNYSPVSLNIVDYWNKDIIDNAAIIPEKTKGQIIDIVHPFEFAESTPEVDKDFGLGFKHESGVGGSLVDIKGTFDEKLNTSLCYTELDERFYLNTTIGLQDKLAYNHMNNFYTSVFKTTKDTVISQRIYFILKELGLDTEGLFGNVNSIFTEDKFLANRNYIGKKGTPASMKYAGRTAYDGQLQGKVPLSGDFYFDIFTNGAFDYSVESNLLGVIFERFVKPLSHPIGMKYNYRTVCTSPVADKTEYPLIVLDYSMTTIQVRCLCFNRNQDDVPLPTDPQEFDCLFSNYPEPKVFATPDGTGLWEGISVDEGFGNIPYKYEEGVSLDYEFKGQSYEKWIFRNDNYLIVHEKIPEINNTSIRKNIRYYRYDANANDYVLGAEFINGRHCDVEVIGLPEKKSYVIETFDPYCEDVIFGVFQFLDEGETTPPETPAPSGMYEGFISDLEDDDIPTPKTGGILEKYTTIYFGIFQFLGEEESLDYEIGEWPESWMTEGFGESMLEQIAIPEAELVSLTTQEEFLSVKSQQTIY